MPGPLRLPPAPRPCSLRSRGHRPAGPVGDRRHGGRRAGPRPGAPGEPPLDPAVRRYRARLRRAVLRWRQSIRAQRVGRSPRRDPRGAAPHPRRSRRGPGVPLDSAGHRHPEAHDYRQLAARPHRPKSVVAPGGTRAACRALDPGHPRHSPARCGSVVADARARREAPGPVSRGRGAEPPRLLGGGALGQVRDDLQAGGFSACRIAGQNASNPQSLLKVGVAWFTPAFSPAEKKAVRLAGWLAQMRPDREAQGRSTSQEGRMR
jgi:hypothetical protein